MTVVVDASVAVRWHFDLPNTIEWRSIISPGEALIAPDLVISESVNAIWRLARAGQIDETLATAIVASLPNEFAQLIPSALLASAAFAIARELDHPAYDCHYLALLDQTTSTFATADRKLLRRIRTTRWQHRLHPLSAAIPA